MEKDRFNKGIEDIKNIKLSNKEKEVIFTRLQNYTKENPIPLNKPIKSPWYNIQYFHFSQLSYVAVFLVFIFTGANTFSLAQKSLPGDTLYTLKVSVIEPLKYKVAIDSLSKANIEAENLATRFEEAEILEAEGRLTPSSQIEIESRIKRHANSFNILVSSSLNTDSNEGAELSTSETRLSDENVNVGNNENVTMMSVKMEEPTSSLKSNKEASLRVVENATTTNIRELNSKNKNTEFLIRNIKNNLEKSRKTKTKINKDVLDETEVNFRNIEARENINYKED